MTEYSKKMSSKKTIITFLTTIASLCSWSFLSSLKLRLSWPLCIWSKGNGSTLLSSKGGERVPEERGVTPTAHHD